MKKIFAFTLLFFGYNSFGQFITHGPVVGGVSDAQARIYLKTGSQSKSFDLELSSSESFDDVLLFSDSTRLDKFGSVIVDCTGLDADTKYFYRFTFDDQLDASMGSFKTFPEENSTTPLKIVVGSCNYGNNPSLFTQIQNFEPHLFVHLGDWGWPPAQLGNDYCLYPDKQAESFAIRYTDPSMENYIQPYMPVEYIYDDDYSYNDSEGWTYPTFSVENNGGVISTELVTNQMPIGIREGAIKSYFDNFPGYESVDTTQGIYHSFRMGNLEFFMLDTRNSRMPRHDAFEYDAQNETWLFEPDSVNHTMLGEAQRNWLLEGLQASEADWKIIGSSVIFNSYYAEILKVALVFQGLEVNIAGQNGSGATLASNLAYNWVGYPADQQALLDVYQSGAVQDLLLLSGDSHSTALDDGTNAGIPELTASGFAAGDEAVINYYVDSIGALIGYPPVEEALWNGGGNAVSNLNFNDSFGTVEVFGKDSLRYCAYDENGFEFGCITLNHSSLSTGVKALSVDDEFEVFHLDASSELIIKCDADLLGELKVLKLYNSAGLILDQISLNLEEYVYDTSDLVAGVYILVLDERAKKLSKKFVKP